MSIQHIAAPQAVANGPLAKPFHLACFALCVAHVVFLVGMLVQGQWLIDSAGRGIPTDFVNVWAAGKLALEGSPAAAYDWTIHKQVENGAVGYDFSGYYAWLYPPPFLAVAALLALFPYVAAYAAWVAATLPVYLITIRWLVAHRLGYLLAGAFPTVLSNAIVGQNGFVTASLIGGTLGFMERQPVLAGCCLGLLTYKPHFGILFPLVLIAARRWTVFFVAAAVGVAMAAASWLAFGMATWEAFFRELPLASRDYLSAGTSDWQKLQSVFGLVRVMGGAEYLAWSLQISLAVFVAVALCILWRGRARFELKAAALAAGALLATPYVYLYDLVVLAIPVALLVRVALKTGFLRSEGIALVIAAALSFSFPFVKLPVGLAATVLVAALIARRTFFAQSEPTNG